MKSIIHILIGIVLFFVSGIFYSSVLAQSYRDDFDVLKEGNWELWGEFSIWKTDHKK